MKKLFLSLLTFATATTAVCGFAACSLGKTGGGDTAARNARNSVQEEQIIEAQPDIDGTEGQTADGEFEFLPPDMQTQNDEPMPLPLPPQGRIFSPRTRHPELIHDAPMAGQAKDGAALDDNRPKGKIPKKKDGRYDDLVTPDGSIVPDVRGTDSDTSCDDDNCKNIGQSSKSAPEASSEGQKKGKNNKRKNKPEDKQTKNLQPKK